MNLSSFPSAARSLERWLREAIADAAYKERLARGVIGSPDTVAAYARMADAHKKAREAYAQELAVLQAEMRRGADAGV